MEHAILTRIKRESFTPLGWFETQAADGVPGNAAFVMLIGNAGPQMYRRFASECDPSRTLMDDWTRATVDRLAADLDARAVYPFDTPPLPFLTWARRAKAGFVSPLGLNIHPTYGLWHAFRAALLFPVVFDLPTGHPGTSPCETCAGKPCLTACPVAAFDGTSYDYRSCGQFLQTDAGSDCMDNSCAARRACPVGRDYEYAKAQKQFHMRAFLKARQQEAS